MRHHHTYGTVVWLGLVGCQERQLCSTVIQRFCRLSASVSEKCHPQRRYMMSVDAWIDVAFVILAPWHKCQFTYMLTCLLTYLFTYLLTLQWHVAVLSVRRYSRLSVLRVLSCAGETPYHQPNWSSFVLALRERVQHAGSDQADYFQVLRGILTMSHCTWVNEDISEVFWPCRTVRGWMRTYLRYSDHVALYAGEWGHIWGILTMSHCTWMNDWRRVCLVLLLMPHCCILSISVLEELKLTLLFDFKPNIKSYHNSAKIKWQTMWSAEKWHFLCQMRHYVKILLWHFQNFLCNSLLTNSG